MAQQQDLHLLGRCSHASSGAADHTEPNRQPDTVPSPTPDNPAFHIEPDTVANAVADTVAFRFEPDIIALFAGTDSVPHCDAVHHLAYRTGRDGFSNAESDIGAVSKNNPDGPTKHTVYPWR